jgi:hypothetical protein
MFLVVILEIFNLCVFWRDNCNLQWLLLFFFFKENHTKILYSCD